MKRAILLFSLAIAVLAGFILYLKLTSPSVALKDIPKRAEKMEASNSSPGLGSLSPLSEETNEVRQMAAIEQPGEIVEEMEVSKPAVEEEGTQADIQSISVEQNQNMEESAELLLEEKRRIEEVIFDRFVGGYNSKDINRYLSAFWEEGFLYHSSQGTEDPSDDVEFTDLEIERRSALKIFEMFPFINLEISDLEIQIDETNPDRAEVRFRYSMTCSSEDRRLFCEGEGKFLMERRVYQGNEEWRIKEWYDKQFAM